MTARWPCKCSSTGCRAARTEERLCRSDATRLARYAGKTRPLAGPGVCQRGSVGDAQLPVNPMQVDLDGALRQPEAPTNFLVGNTLREHQDYLSLNGEMAH